MQDSSMPKTVMQNIGANNKAHLIVVGGSSGIGLTLALHHLKLGWQVSIVGSSAAKIALINDEHPSIATYQCDLKVMVERQSLFSDLEKASFDRLIYSAGCYTNERMQALSQADSDAMLSINLQVFNEVFDWASRQLKHRDAKSSLSSKTPPIKPGLVCIASIAGTMDYPYSSLYAKSKRAMIATSSAYRCALNPFDIQVNCIASGYINTQALRDLNDGDASHKPFIIDVDTAVMQIMQAIDNDVELAVFPKSMRYLTRMLNRLPKALINKLLKGKLDK